MKEIPLSQRIVKKYAHLKLSAQVDNEDYDWANQWGWHLKKGRHTYYAVRNIKLDSGKSTSISLHREIMRRYGKLNESKFIDHVDGNGLNCLKENLRSCTNDENVRNRTANHGSTSKYKGVSRRVFNKKCVRYIVMLKQKHIACCEIEIDAALKYNEAARKEYGEFAFLNCVPIPTIPMKQYLPHGF